MKYMQDIYPCRELEDKYETIAVIHQYYAYTNPAFIMNVRHSNETSFRCCEHNGLCTKTDCEYFKPRMPVR